MEKMDKIKKYVDRFIATAKVNEKYDMSAMELLALANRANSGDALCSKYHFRFRLCQRIPGGNG